MMLKNCKKMLSLAFALMFALVCTVPAFGATISWDASDITAETTLFQENLNSLTGMQYSVNVNTTEFASDSAHLNVLPTGSSFIAIQNELMRNYIDAEHAIRVQFDYYATASDSLRIELRELARNTSNSELTQSQQSYWTGDTTNKSVTGDGSWHTFDGTLNVKSCVSALQGLSNFKELRSNAAYFLIKGNSSTTIYFDNFNISAAPFPIPVNDPVIIPQTPWTKVADAEGHKNIYQGSINVSSNGQQSCAFSGVAPGFFVNGSTYQISLWFKEDASNANQMTRMWRFYNKYNNSGAADVKMAPLNSYFYHNPSITSAPVLGTWKQITQTFTVGTQTNTDSLVGGGAFSIYWQGRVSSGDNVNWNYDASQNGTYNISVSDFEITRVPAVSSNSSTVAFDEMQYVQLGNSLAVPVTGYFDETIAPQVTIKGVPIVGAWQNVTVDGKYRTGTANFYSVVASAYSLESLSASLSITDIWGNIKTNPATVIFTKEQTQEVKVLTGDWTDIGLNVPNQVINKNAFASNSSISMSPFFANGKALIKFSFSAQGVSGKTYTQNLDIQFRTGNGGEVCITVPAADLQDGEIHNYSKIVDLGGVNRYYTVNNSSANDRTTSNFGIYLRSGANDGNNVTENTVSYSNINLQYFDPYALNKEYVLSFLSITNNVTQRFSPSGMLIFAKYEGKKLVDVKYKTVSYTDTTVGLANLNNALGQSESKKLYLTGNEVADGIITGEQFYKSTALEEYVGTYTYKAFYWNSFADITPITGSATKAAE